HDSERADHSLCGGRAATVSTCRNATPTRRACGSRGRSGCRPLRMVVEEAAADPRVGVDPAVAQKRPAAPHLLDAPEVDLTQHDRLPVLGPRGHDRTERTRETGRTPEF